MDAGQILRESRLRSGLSQRRLADLAGITQPTVARIESGLIQPTFERLLDLVRACGLDLDVRVVPLDEDAWTVARRGGRRRRSDARGPRAPGGQRCLSSIRGRSSMRSIGTACATS